MSDDMAVEQTEASTDDVPMESSEDTPVPDDTSDVAAGEDENEEEDESKSVSSTTNIAPDEEGEEEIKSVGTAPEEEEEIKSVGTSDAADENDNETPAEGALASPESAPSSAAAAPPPKKKRGKPQIPASARKGRAPAVKGLNIPFRTVKKAMKLDPDIPIVQNEAAIMTTLAAELFLKRLANQSQKICKNRGKNTIRYEDVADARANDPSLAFLKTIIP